MARGRVARLGVALAGGSLAGGGDAGGALGAVDGLAAGVRDGAGDSEATVGDRVGVGVGACDGRRARLRLEGDDGDGPGSDGAERLTTIRRVPSLDPKTVCGSVASSTG